MASIERKLLEQGFKSLLKEFGFRKSGPTWRRSVDDSIQVFNIQGSQWSKSFFINLGIYFKPIGEKEKPNEYECHIRERLTGLVADIEECNNLLDFEKEIEIENRISTLCSLASNFAIPWLEICSTKSGARHYLLNEKKHGLPVSKAAYEYLGIASS